MFRLFVVFSLFALTACVDTYTPPTQQEIEEQRAQSAKQAIFECQLSECTLLNLDSTLIEDFSVLNDMPHVTKLMMSRTNIEDLSQIAGMTQLKELHIAWTDVSDLAGLAAFPNLELLHANNLSQNPSYAPVFKMRALKELSLDARPSDGLNFVRNMPRLQTLLFMGGEISDFAPLAGNRSIQHLGLPNTIPEDATPLLRMRDLRMLNAEDTGLDPAIAEQLEQKGISVQLFLPVVVC